MLQPRGTSRTIYYILELMALILWHISVVGKYEAMQELESLMLLHDFIARPKEFTRHCHRFSASLVFTLSYGKRLGDDDKDLNDILNVVANFVKETYPGAHFVDMFPALDYLPDFLAPWRSRARANHVSEMKVRLQTFSQIPLSNFYLHMLSPVVWSARFRRQAQDG